MTSRHCAGSFGEGSAKVEVRCECGQYATFRGADIDAVIAVIGSNGWVFSGAGGAWWLRGVCPDCVRKEWRAQQKKGSKPIR